MPVLSVLLLAAVHLGTACRGPISRIEAPSYPHQESLQPEGVRAPMELGEPEADGDWVDPTADASAKREWSVRFRLPIKVGYTDFHLGEGPDLDNLTALSVVPTAEFVRPLAKEWTLVPFMGFGGGWLIDDDEKIAILTSGIQVEWAHEVDDLHSLRIVPRIRYDANLNRPDGLLGDWGRVDLSVELIRSFGTSDEAIRFAPGVYAQGFMYWDDIDLELPGLTPASADDQVELGFSLGTRDRVEILGIPLPRIYIGYRFGDGLETLRVRLGGL